MTKKPNTYLDHLDRLPPVACFMLARRNGRPIKLAEIRKSSGLSRRKVIAMAKATTWRPFAIGDIDSFRMACGITVRNEPRHFWYLRQTWRRMRDGGGMSHLKHVHPRTLALIRQALTAGAAAK